MLVEFQVKQRVVAKGKNLREPRPNIQKRGLDWINLSSNLRLLLALSLSNSWIWNKLAALCSNPILSRINIWFLGNCSYLISIIVLQSAHASHIRHIRLILIMVLIELLNSMLNVFEISSYIRVASLSSGF